jgi:catechol 2,3-dioxygenase-like lactoylglutathione lyase family enzyme
MDETLRFYTEIFPFEVLKQAPAANQFILRCGDLYLELLLADEPVTHGGAPGPLHHLGISVKNVDEALTFLKARGLPEDRCTRPALKRNLDPERTYRSAGVTGPNGEILGLYELENAVYFK